MRPESLLILLLLFAAPAFALTAETPLPDAAQEARAQALFYQFRCVVCQGQSLAESDAPLAQDIRMEIRGRITAGKTDAQIRSYLTSRYGDFILMKPPVSWRSALLWLGPLLLLLTGALLVGRIFIRRAA
jgi:cytochrome c-type biogenesis protein CcmH